MALLVIGVVIAGAGDLGHSAPRTLDTSAVASQISLSIQENRNTSIPVLVACPSHEPIKVGFQFDCSLSGVPQKVVHVTEVDNRGEVRWSLGP